MVSTSIKIKISIIFLLALLLSASCLGLSEDVNQNVLTTAWLTCKSATGKSTNQAISGKTVLVWNLHNDMDYHLDNKNVHTEIVGDTMLSSAPYFILGETSKNKDYSSLLTLNLNEATAFLCVSVTYVDIETCYYDDENYIVRSKSDAEIKLVSWPDEQIIAETRYSSTQPEECPAYFLSRSDLSNHLVRVNNIDIFDWFSNLSK